LECLALARLLLGNVRYVLSLVTGPRADPPCALWNQLRASLDASAEALSGLQATSMPAGTRLARTIAATELQGVAYTALSCQRVRARGGRCAMCFRS